MRAPSRTAIGLASLLVASACYDDVPDQTVDLASEDLSLRVLAHTGAEATEVEMWFSPPEPAGPVRFSVGDRVSIESDGLALALARKPGGAFVSTLPRELLRWQVVLDRSVEESGRVDIVMIPPARLTSAPAASRAALHEITWDPTGDPSARTILTVRGACFEPVERALDGDPGAYLLQPADFASSGETCTAEATLDRTLHRFDPATILEAVRVDLSRTDTVRWESNP